MSQAEPSWELYGTFLAVLRSGSLSAAARELGLAQPTVRSRIAALETALDAVLFTRAPSGLVPTEAASSMRVHAEAMEASARALARAVSAPADEERGTVRVTASEVVGVEVLPPILASLRALHPSIQIELSLGNRNQDLLRRDADVAVRMIAPTQAALVAKRVGAVDVGLYASAGYLEGREAPRTPADLLAHDLIGDDRERGIMQALSAAGVAARARHFVLRTDNQLAQLAALRAGVGIGPCQIPLAGDLVRVLGDVAFPLEVWVVTHEDLRAVRRVRAVFDELVRALGVYVGGRGRRSDRSARERKDPRLRR
ncbi:MAG: LysR family transcriptional regulator [Sandaracinaceae bacterium]